jgi:hypothetical protein
MLVESSLDPDERKKDDDYLRVLDGFARFYNSQITAHAGYMLATGIGVFTGFVAIIVNSDKILGFLQSLGIQWNWAGLVLIGVVVVIGSLYLSSYRWYPLCWICSIYHFARLQYYDALSEAVLNHLPYTSTDARGLYYTELKKRAIEPYGDFGEVRILGIGNAILRLFEARLYVSCQRDKKHIDDYELDPHEQALFHLSSFYERFTLGRCYAGKKFKFWHKTYSDLLLVAYRSTLLRYCRDARDAANSENAKIWSLFKPFVDC